MFKRAQENKNEKRKSTVNKCFANGGGVDTFMREWSETQQHVDTTGLLGKQHMSSS